MKTPFLNTLLGFTPYADYKPTNAFHADSPGRYTSQKIINLSTIDKVHPKCDVIDGSVLNGPRQAILCSFVLGKPPGYKVFCEPEAILYKKINKSVLNTIRFYLEDDDTKEIKFNGETLTFTSQ